MLIIHAFLDREWDPKTKVQNTLFDILSLFIVDFVFSFQTNTKYFLGLNVFSLDRF